MKSGTYCAEHICKFYALGKKKPNQKLLLKDKATPGKGEQPTPLIFFLLQQETRRLPEESLTHSGSLNSKKARQLLTEHVSFQKTRFPQESNKLLWLNLQGFCWFGWLLRFFFPKLLFPRVRYIKLNIGKQSSVFRLGCSMSKFHHACIFFHLMFP